MKIGDLLLIDDEEILTEIEILAVKITYRQGFWNRVISFFNKKNKDTKTFDLKNWLTFKEGIIKNLFEKGLCKIEFIK